MQVSVIGRFDRGVRLFERLCGGDNVHGPVVDVPLVLDHTGVVTDVQFKRSSFDGPVPRCLIGSARGIVAYDTLSQPGFRYSLKIKLLSIDLISRQVGAPRH
jgi:hypothetical protein